MISQISTPLHFNSLPTEIQSKIFSFLDDASTYHASQVCRLWNQVCIDSVKGEQQANLKRLIGCVVSQLDTEKYLDQIQKLNHLCEIYFPDCWKHADSLKGIKAQLTHFQHMIFHELRPVKTKCKKQIFGKLSDQVTQGKEMPKFFTTSQKLIEHLNSVPIIEDIENNESPEITLEIIHQFLSHCDAIVLFIGPEKAAKILGSLRTNPIRLLIDAYVGYNSSKIPDLKALYKTTKLCADEAIKINFCPFVCAYLLIQGRFEKAELELFAENAGRFRKGFMASLVIHYILADRFNDALAWVTPEEIPHLSYELLKLSQQEIYILLETMIQNEMNDQLMLCIHEACLLFNELDIVQDDTLHKFFKSVNMLIEKYPFFQNMYYLEITKAFWLDIPNKWSIYKVRAPVIFRMVQSLEEDDLRNQLISTFMDNRLSVKMTLHEFNSVFSLIYQHSDIQTQKSLYNYFINNDAKFILGTESFEYPPQTSHTYYTSDLLIKWLKQNVSFSEFWCICGGIIPQKMQKSKQHGTKPEPFVEAINYFSRSSAAEIMDTINKTKYLPPFIALKVENGLPLIQHQEIRTLLTRLYLQKSIMDSNNTNFPLSLNEPGPSVERPLTFDQVNNLYNLIHQLSIQIDNGVPVSLDDHGELRQKCQTAITWLENNNHHSFAQEFINVFRPLDEVLRYIPTSKKRKIDLK